MADSLVRKPIPEYQPRILVIDDDNDVASIVDEFLSEEGYAVTIMRHGDLDSVHSAIEQQRPDCVLLDGYAIGRSDGAAWEEAAWMASRRSEIPVVMFSASRKATDEARRNESARSRAAGFAAVLSKPFTLDELLKVVTLAVSRSPFRHGSNG